MLKIIFFSLGAVLAYCLGGYEEFVMYMLCAIFLKEVIKDDDF